MVKIVKYKSVFKTFLLCLTSCFFLHSLSAQKISLKREFIKNLNEKGFESFVAEINEFLEKAPVIMEREAAKRELSCDDDNDLSELKFKNPRYVNNTYEPKELQPLVKQYARNFSFVQSHNNKSSSINLIPNYEFEDKIFTYVRAGVSLKTVIHSMVYEDGSVLADQVTFEGSILEMPTTKRITEIQASITVEYPEVKKYSITNGYQKITIGKESITIRFNGNKVQVSVSEKNTGYLTLDTSLNINAIHKTEKSLESLSNSNKKGLNEKSFKALETTVKMLEKVFKKVNAKKIKTSEKLIEAIEEMSDTAIESNWNHNTCYYGDVDKVLLYHSTGSYQTITEELTLKVKN